MTKENLVLDVKPEQLCTYGKLLVAFFDGYKNKTIDEFEGVQIAEDAQPELYIHIQSGDDKYSVVRRRAQIRRDKVGRRVPEEKLFQIVVRQCVPSSHDLADKLFQTVYKGVAADAPTDRAD